MTDKTFDCRLIPLPMSVKYRTSLCRTSGVLGWIVEMRARPTSKSMRSPSSPPICRFPGSPAGSTSDGLEYASCDPVVVPVLSMVSTGSVVSGLKYLAKCSLPSGPNGMTIIYDQLHTNYYQPTVNVEK